MKMPAEMKKDWIEALRSGEYIQGENALEKDGAYCCLGVLQCVVDGDVQRVDKLSRSLPTTEWAHGHGLRDQWSIWGFNDLALMNDIEKKSFAEIADWIEENVEEL